jgi:hypothetical protein
MAKRRADPTTSPSDPAEASPADEAHRLGFPLWAQREIQTTKVRIKSSPSSLTEEELERFSFLRRWEQQEREQAQQERENLMEERERARQEQVQEREQNRERQVEKLERQIRARAGARKRSDAIRVPTRRRAAPRTRLARD